MNLTNEAMNNERTVTIKDGVYMGKAINGTYKLLAPWWMCGDPSRDPKNGKVRIVIGTSHRGVWVNEEDCTYSEGPVYQEEALSDEEILSKIKSRFSVMGRLTTGIIAGNIRSLMISGAPGVGKSFEMEKKLFTADVQGDVAGYETVKGKVSPIGLYIKLWENREAGMVTVLDDIDVFGNEDVLNVLKAALDSGEKRIISWSTASSYLEEKDIPNSFEYEGSVVFITNTNIDKELNANSKVAPHLAALVNRSVYLDLKVHTNREVLLWIEHVISSTSMLEEKGLNNFQIVEMIEWLKEKVDHLRSLSLRTCLYLADFILTDGEGWREMADATMCV